MSTLEFCIARRKAEHGAFVRVLKAVPAGKLDYRPDPKARSAGELAFMLATEEAALLPLLETGVVDWKDVKHPKSVDEIVSLFEKSAKAVDDRLTKLDAGAWQKKAQFKMGGQVVWEDTLANMMWGFHVDAIHHRGQLSVYLRPMGSKVPSIYGPSADDSGQ
jgi:uncharacterized damage-inducible protein DinB